MKKSTESVVRWSFVLMGLCFSLKSTAQSTSISTEATPGSVEGTSQIYIKMGDARTKKSLVAFPDLRFVGNPAIVLNHKTIGNDFFQVIQNDLSISSYFQFINKSAFLEDVSDKSIRPFPNDTNGFKFDSWKQIGVEFLIRGAFTLAGNELSLEVLVYHVPRSALVFGKKYRSSLDNQRRMAHIFCNDLLESLTGKRGVFLSKVVATSDVSGNKYREVYVMDWDGAGVKKITNHKSIALSPSWSPDGTKVAYTAFVQRARTKARNADLFIYELLTGRRLLVSYRQGLNSGSSFSPDGKALLLTLSQSDNPDIYLISTDGAILSRLTNGPRGAMNVEPTFSPDGKKIAFSSDRSGQPMIYIMDARGDQGTAKRLTFAGHYNATPAFSPDGKKLAFSGWEKDHFDIFVMNVDGSEMVRVTSAKKPNGKWAMNEDPVFSADGRLLMYTSNRTGSNQIYISNLDGSDERRITNDSANYFKPKWSINID